MDRMRTPLQGVTNIVRFNWHFYLIATALVLLGLAVAPLLSSFLQTGLYLALSGAILTTLISLAVSFHVYDRSQLYRLDWLDELTLPDHPTIANIHAGFDEISALLECKQPDAQQLTWDFYDENQHTEISIRRARKAYPPHPETKQIATDQLPNEDASVDLAILFLAAHEIRDPEERAVFLKQLNRILKPAGRLVVTEHLRDLPNFLAYTIGFLHFYSRSTWVESFKSAGFRLVEERKATQFVSTFILEKR